jgi:hypothetical protein
MCSSGNSLITIENANLSTMAEAQTIKDLTSKVNKLSAQNRVLSVNYGSTGGTFDSFLRNYSRSYIRTGR